MTMGNGSSRIQKSNMNKILIVNPDSTQDGFYYSIEYKPIEDIESNLIKHIDTMNFRYKYAPTINVCKSAVNFYINNGGDKNDIKIIVSKNR